MYGLWMPKNSWLFNVVHHRPLHLMAIGIVVSLLRPRGSVQSWKLIMWSIKMAVFGIYSIFERTFSPKNEWTTSSKGLGFAMEKDFTTSFGSSFFVFQSFFWGVASPNNAPTICSYKVNTIRKNPSERFWASRSFGAAGRTTAGGSCAQGTLIELGWWVILGCFLWA